MGPVARAGCGGGLAVLSPQRAHPLARAIPVRAGMPADASVRSSPRRTRVGWRFEPARGQRPQRQVSARPLALTHNLGRAAALCAAVLLVAGCAMPRYDAPRVASHAIDDPESTP